MPKFPCATKVVCDVQAYAGIGASIYDVDSPIGNYSSEEPEKPIYFRRNYNWPPNIGGWTFGAQGCGGICWSTVSQAEADACAAGMVGECFVGNECTEEPCKPLPEGAWNTPQTCSRPCPTAPGGMVSYTTPAQRFRWPDETGIETTCDVSGLSSNQEKANCLAYEHACKMVAILCEDPHFVAKENTAQACTYICADGTEKVFVVPAGFFEAVDQLTANALAYTWACAIASSFCTEPEWAYNTEVTAYANCPDGSEFSYTVPAGAFSAGTAEQANQQASAFAYQQALKKRICMLPIETKGCVGNVPAIVAECAGGILPITWSVVGSLPAGFSLKVNPSNLRQVAIIGGGSAAGDFEFQIKATDINGNYSQKSVKIHVIEIANAFAIHDGFEGVPFVEQLAVTGTMTPPVSWQVITGSLPPGLTLDEATGKISGTPTEIGVFNFRISVQDEAT